MKIQLHLYTILFVLFLSSCASNQSTFSITYVSNSIPNRQQLLDSIFLLGNPFIANGEATILAKSTSKNLSIAGDFNQWNPEKNPLKRIQGTSYQFYTIPIEHDTYLEYKLVDEENWYGDPNNPHKTSGGKYINSLLTGVEYQRPIETFEHDICQGNLDTLSLFGPKLNKEYRIIIYVPCT